MQAVAQIASTGASGRLLQRPNAPSSIAMPSKPRPLSEATEIFDEFEDDGSEFEEYPHKNSFESYDSRRRSQTTLSSYDEASTPPPTDITRPQGLRMSSVQGPKGPHLFRSSQVSSEFSFDHTLQMSPLFPKQMVLRSETAFSQETITPTNVEQQGDTSIASVLVGAQSQIDRDNSISKWTNDDVIDWMVGEEIDAYSINCFEAHDITGSILLNLHFEDLKELDVQSFGKRHELWAAIAKLKGDQPPPSPTPTLFEDTSRPCTTNPRLPYRDDANEVEGNKARHELGSIDTANKRRGRKAPKQLDIISPQESVSIVAIEQLLPKPHRCAKGERCAKYRKQQRQLQQLQDQSAMGRFPISPTNGGRIHIAGDPGNATVAENIVPNVRRQHAVDLLPPQSAGFPSVVASSDVFGPNEPPEFALRADALERLELRDPQENVKQFLNLQHVPTPPSMSLPVTIASPPRSRTAPPATERPHHDLLNGPGANTSSSSPLQRKHSVGANHRRQTLPRLDIPATPTIDRQDAATREPRSAAAVDIGRSPDASLPMIYRLGTPASDMDVPHTPYDTVLIDREASQSVPPSMHYRDQQHRTSSRPPSDNWRRPSLGLPPVKEDEVLSPSDTHSGCSQPSSSSRHSSKSSSITTPASSSVRKVRDPAHDSPRTIQFGYGESCSHAGWMRKRRTKMLRHEWRDAHFRLHGTQLAMHESARLSAAELDRINVDDYSVACSTMRSDGKLTAALKTLHIMDDARKKEDPAPFAFQLVPSRDATAKPEDRRHLFTSPQGKTHHFAVKSKDERIDWMRELMLAKALQQKGKGYEVEVNGKVL